MVVNEKKYKGVAITLFDSNNNDAWYDKTLPKIKKLGGELEVVTIVTVKNTNDPTPLNDPKISDKLNRLIRKSKQYRVKISLIKPHLMTPDQGDSFNRTTYNPSDVNLFFFKWQEIMSYYASVSKQNNIPLLSLSCETAYLSQNIYTSYWQSIINQVKLVNPHLKLTMSLTKGELDRELKYHEQGIKSVSTILDYVGLDMYPRVIRQDNKKKIKINDDYFLKIDNSYGFIESIKKVKQYFNKKVLITETGATSRSDRSKKYNYIPSINSNLSDPTDHIDQNQWIKVVLSIVLQMDEVEGVYVWHVNYPFQFLDSNTAKTIKALYNKY